ncbi:MAG: rRNA maturation RNase YbeY [Treponema sp.]|jgi:probable rRNA maturation factor|nr:rRNA maturation RNase YbeY [Treponema sp.]
MNNVAINAQDIDLPDWSDKASQFALKVLKEINRNNWELSILFCGDKTITELNLKYRSKKEPTDILSFNLGETITCDNGEGAATVYLPGDIVISMETLQENAKNLQITEDEELRRLIIHGILHLDGMNHETNDKQEPMLALQEEILVRLAGERIMGGII